MAELTLDKNTLTELYRQPYEVGALAQAARLGARRERNQPVLARSTAADLSVAVWPPPTPADTGGSLAPDAGPLDRKTGPPDKQTTIMIDHSPEVTSSANDGR